MLSTWRCVCWWFHPHWLGLSRVRSRVTVTVTLGGLNLCIIYIYIYASKSKSKNRSETLIKSIGEKMKRLNIVISVQHWFPSCSTCRFTSIYLSPCKKHRIVLSLLLESCTGYNTPVVAVVCLQIACTFFNNFCYLSQNPTIGLSVSLPPGVSPVIPPLINRIVLLSLWPLLTSHIYVSISVYL